MKRYWLSKICRRKSDGSLWRPSTPPGYDYGDAMRDTVSGVSRFYFIGICRVHRWWWRDYWQDTAEVWAPSSGEFQVLNQGEVLPT